MHFDNLFFRDEIRDDFYVPGMIKRSWAVQLDMLEKIIGVCERHNIHWFIDYGTIIGAKRHGGFIPWDDDIDISMLQDDYLEFLKYAYDELPEDYSILTPDKDIGFNNFLARVVCGKGINLSVDYLNSHFGFPYVTGIDIFPLNYLFPDEEKENKRRERLVKLWNLCGIIRGNNDEKIKADSFAEAQRAAGFSLDKSVSRDDAIIRAIYRIFFECSGDEAKESTEVVLMPYYIKDKTSHRLPIDLYKETEDCLFEGLKVRIPKHYDEIVTHIYGDWRNPVRGGGVHEYPAYASQEETLKKHSGGSLYYKYSFTPEDLENPERQQKIAEYETDNPVQPGAPRAKLILFIVPERKAWDNIAPIYEKKAKDPFSLILVMPVPWYERGFDGNQGAEHFEFDGYPQGVTVFDFRKFDYENLLPDEIIITDPYDEYELAKTVHPFFYASNLRKYTRKLTCVPEVVPENLDIWDGKTRINAAFFITTPGIVMSDEVLVKNQGQKDCYIKYLTEMTDIKYRDIWQNKIRLTEEYLSD